jgi:hypothetical protein
MKSFNILLVFLVLLVSCKNKQKPADESENVQIEKNYASFGKLIDYKGAIGSEDMLDQFQSLKEADTLETKFSATVTAVCKSKGCWMKLNLKNGEEVMVKFKDYGFFVPKDIEGREVVLNGIAFVDNMSVDDQRHYAKDAGKSQEDIRQIKEPKRTFEFEADGVLIGQ